MEMTTCALCQNDVRCINFKIPECQHGFHYQCVSHWPINECPTCSTTTYGIQPILVQDTSSLHNSPRVGKWTDEEGKYIDRLLELFIQGHVYCAHGISIRVVLSRVLNCDPMRLSKKFQKKPLGKHTFRMPKTGVIVSENASGHVSFQNEIFNLEKAFLSSLNDLGMKEIKMEKSYLHETHFLKRYQGREYMDMHKAIRIFWQEQFLSFCQHLGQCVLGFEFQKKTTHIVSKKNNGTSRKKKLPLSFEVENCLPWIKSKCHKRRKPMIVSASSLPAELPVPWSSYGQLLSLTHSCSSDSLTSVDSLSSLSEPFPVKVNTMGPEVIFPILDWQHSTLLDLPTLETLPCMTDFHFEPYIRY